VRDNSAPIDSSWPNDLTAREREVLHLIASGLSTKEVAANLGISFKTAACHRANIMSKLGLHSVVDLVRYTLQAPQHSHGLERKRLEQSYQEKLREAEQDYRLAAERHKEAITRAQKTNWKLDADGQQALHVAGLMEREAVEKYAQALKVFADLIMNGPKR
jgi:DNA-binding CsgD family transcriptional regulator